MGGQAAKQFIKPNPKPSPDPEDHGWEPICTAKGMETYIVRCSNLNYVLGRISPRYQPLWVRIWYWFKPVWLWGTNKKGCKKIWLGTILTKEILENLHKKM